MIAYVFPDFVSCAAALALTEQKMRDIAAVRGFTVLPDGSVVGKNAATGADDPSCITIRWSLPLETADGRWCFPSIRNTFQTTYPIIEAFAALPAPVEVTLPVDASASLPPDES